MKYCDMGKLRPYFSKTYSFVISERGTGEKMFRKRALEYAAKKGKQVKDDLISRNSAIDAICAACDAKKFFPCNIDNSPCETVIILRGLQPAVAMTGEAAKEKGEKMNSYTSNGICPICKMEMQHICLASNPPKFKTICFNCGHEEGREA